jgi:hypothetical protein
LSISLVRSTDDSYNLAGSLERLTPHGTDILLLQDLGLANKPTITKSGKVCGVVFVNDVFHTYIDDMRKAQDPVVNGIKMNTPLPQ